MLSIGRYPLKNLKSRILAFFLFCVSELCTMSYIANAPLTTMLTILSDPIINKKMHFYPNKHVLATLLQDFLFFYQFATNQYKINNI